MSCSANRANAARNGATAVHCIVPTCIIKAWPMMLGRHLDDIVGSYRNLAKGSCGNQLGWAVIPVWLWQHVQYGSLDMR